MKSGNEEAMPDVIDSVLDAVILEVFARPNFSLRTKLRSAIEKFQGQSAAEGKLNLEVWPGNVRANYLPPAVLLERVEQLVQWAELQLRTVDDPEVEGAMDRFLVQVTQLLNACACVYSDTTGPNYTGLPAARALLKCESEETLKQIEALRLGKSVRCSEVNGPASAVEVGMNTAGRMYLGITGASNVLLDRLEAERVHSRILEVLESMPIRR